jgi:hypothetical protein
VVHLGDNDFQVVDIIAVALVKPLDQGQRRQLGQYSGCQALERLGVVAPDHELVAQLREQGFDALAGFPQHGAERGEVGLVAAHGRFQPDGGGVEQVLLVLAAQVALVADQDTVVQLRFQVVEVVDIVRRCAGNIKGFDRPVGCAHRMDLIAEIIRLVHRAIAVIRFCAVGLLANAQALGTPELADFQGHAVHEIIIFGRRQHRNHALAEVFNLKRKLPSPPVEDGTVYLPGQCHRQLPEQVAFRVNPCAFGGQGQGDQLLVGKFGDTDLVEEIVLGFQFVQKAKNFVITCT